MPGRRLGEPLELLDPRVEIVDVAVHDGREAWKSVGSGAAAQRLEGSESLFPREQQGLESRREGGRSRAGGGYLVAAAADQEKRLLETRHQELTMAGRAR